MAVLDELGAWAEGLTLGTVGSDIFLASLPSSPDAATLIRTYGRAVPQQLIGGVTAWDRIGVQIIARALSYEAARARIDALYAAVNAFAGDTVLSGVRYMSLTALQEPFPLEFDDRQNRPHLAFNVEAWRVPPE